MIFFAIMKILSGVHHSTKACGRKRESRYQLCLALSSHLMSHDFYMIVRLLFITSFSAALWCIYKSEVKPSSQYVA